MKTFRLFLTTACLPFLFACEARSSKTANPDKVNSASASEELLDANWACEGKVSPLCIKRSTDLYSKIYPKYDKQTCEIINDLSKEFEIVANAFCIIPVADALIISKYLHPQAEIMGIRKGHYEGKTRYEVSYRTGENELTKILDETGAVFPAGSHLNDDDWISSKLLKKVGAVPAVDLEMQILLDVNAYKSANSVEADARLENLEAVKKIIRSVIPAFDFDFVGTSITFPIKISQLKALLPQLKKHTNLIDVAPLICADVEQRFCVTKSDGTFSVSLGTPVEDQCEHAPPPNSVDLSFCSGIP